MKGISPVKSVSVREVAAHAEVSVGTVSNALNHPEKVSEATALRIQRAITELGFVRNDAARQLRAGRSKSVGLIVLDVRSPFFTDLARGAEDRAAESGLSIILANSDKNPTREAAYLDLFEQQRVHGVLLSPFGNVTQRLKQLRARGIPAVLVDRRSADNSFSSVSVDDVGGGFLAVEHLISLGRRRIAFVGGPLDIRQVSDRLRGAKDAIIAHPGVTLETIPTKSLSVVEGRAAGERIGEQAPQDHPDAIFAANDLTAIGVLQGLTATNTNISVPHDIAIIGYDDIEFATAAIVPLSSIRQPSALIGQTAMQILLEEAKDPTVAPRQVVFQSELIVRASSQE